MALFQSGRLREEMIDRALNTTMRDTPKAFGLRQHTMLALYDHDTGEGVAAAKVVEATGYTPEVVTQGLSTCVDERLAECLGEERFRLTEHGRKMVEVGLQPKVPQL